MTFALWLGALSYWKVAIKLCPWRDAYVQQHYSNRLWQSSNINETKVWPVQRVVHSQMHFCSPQLYRVIIWLTVAFQSGWANLVNSSLTTLISTNCFVLIAPFWVNSRDCCTWKPQISRYPESSHQLWSEWVRSHLFLILEVDVNISLTYWPISVFYALQHNWPSRYLHE